MKRLLLTAALLAIATPAAAQIVAKPQSPARPTTAAADAAKFNAAIGQALQFLGKAESYALNVDSEWQATGDADGQKGASRYRLLAQGSKHRIEVQAADAKSPQLIAVSDDKNVTTLLTAQGLYSQHAVGSTGASLESNQLLAQSLAGSAIDILLQPNVGQYVQAQATDLKYHGQEPIRGQACHRFAFVWAGAQVELWLAAMGDPLLVQFVRTASVPTGDDECYEMVHTARFTWQLNAKLPEGTFAVALPKDARRVNDIYDALSGDDPSVNLGKPLPKLELTQLDGSTLPLRASEDKRALVLIFWATWCAPSVEEMPAVSQFVKAGQSEGVVFYAVNVGEAPSDVRQFTAQGPLASVVVLDPKGQASSALRINELPAAVVVAPDNTVRAIVTGTAKEVQAGVAKALQSLPSQATPSKTARRPGDSPVAPK